MKKTQMASKMGLYKLSRGFTLIELLVVISIIALLMSILMPSLSKARKLAQAVVCLSNEKQIGLAFAIYQQEYDNFFPPVHHLLSGSSGEIWNWPTFFVKARLIQDIKFYNCGTLKYKVTESDKRNNDS